MKSSTCSKAFAILVLAHAGLASAKDDGMPILTLNDDENFNFDILTGLGQTHNDGADINPVLEVAKKIKPGDFDSYTKAWFDLANETKAKALDPEYASDPVNVRANWFSASNYFRRADVYNRDDWDDPRINHYWDEQRAAFDMAIAALPVPAERVEIPSDGFNVSGIWYSQLSKCNHTERLPTLILTQGYDAAQEDLYSTIVAPALARGYNVFRLKAPVSRPLAENRVLASYQTGNELLHPLSTTYFRKKAHTSITSDSFYMVTLLEVISAPEPLLLNPDYLR